MIKNNFRNTKKVLIIPMGTETALEIYKSLKDAPDLEIFGADTEPFNAGFCLVKHSVIAPSIDDKDLFLFLKRFIEKEGIDLVFPTHDWFLTSFAQRKKIGKAELVVSDLETIRITRSKELTYKFLNDEIPVPRTYSTNKVPANIRFPLFIKPKTGRGSIQAFKIDNKKELNFYISNVENPLLMEYLPGKEYTIDCLCDLNGHLLATSIRERLKVKGGISMISKIVEDNKISQMAEKIVDKLKFRGGWFFQVKEDENSVPTLLEINARVAGTMCLTRMAGVNIPLLTTRLFLGEKMKYVPPPITNMMVTRHLTEEYIWDDMKDIKCIIWDLDDTLWYGRLCEDEVKIRPQIHCILKELQGRRFILCATSRNPHLIGLKKQKIIQLLKEVGLDDVFSCLEINDRRKSENIKKIASKLQLKLNQILYIDDAFSEREEVRQNLSDVRVFDPSCYSELLNLRPPS